jgi:hypothetical protein
MDADQGVLGDVAHHHGDVLNARALLLKHLHQKGAVLGRDACLRDKLNLLRWGAGLI